MEAKLLDWTSRRQANRWLGCALPLLTPEMARADDLPIHTTGLKRFGFTVPDPEAFARFYFRISTASYWPNFAIPPA